MHRAKVGFMLLSHYHSSQGSSKSPQTPTPQKSPCTTSYPQKECLHSWDLFRQKNTSFPLSSFRKFPFVCFRISAPDNAPWLSLQGGVSLCFAVPGPQLPAVPHLHACPPGRCPGFPFSPHRHHSEPQMALPSSLTTCKE